MLALAVPLHDQFQENFKETMLAAGVAGLLYPMNILKARLINQIKRLSCRVPIVAEVSSGTVAAVDCQIATGTLGAIRARIITVGNAV